MAWNREIILSAKTLDSNLMLKDAALGIVVMLDEAAIRETLLAVDVVCLMFTSVLDPLTNPFRLVATLRS
jgi:soluble P-type ATPase